jgi:hypothetical protein
VTAENQIDSSASGAPQNNRIVCQQQLKLVLARAGQSEWQVFESHHRVIDSRKPESSAFILETHALVDENSYSFRAEEVGDQRCIGPVIVISQDCVNSMTRAQFPQQLSARRRIFALLGNIITGKRNDIRLQAVGCSYGTFNLFAAGKSAVMDVGKLHDPKTIELSRQAPQINLMVFYRKAEGLSQR